MTVEELVSSGLSCYLEQGGKAVFSDTKSGIAPLLSLVKSGQDVRGAVAYDKIVGKAAALLYVLLRVREVHAQVMSTAGCAVLRSHGIVYSCVTQVQQIINRRGDGICPMERTVQNISEPAAAYTALCGTVEKLRKGERV